MTQLPLQPRKRQPISCKRCRERKEKCDRNRTLGCANCKWHKVDCVWFTSTTAQSRPPFSPSDVSPGESSGSSSGIPFAEPIRTPRKSITNSTSGTASESTELPPSGDIQSPCCRLTEEICRRLPSKRVASLLLDRFQEVALVLWNIIDEQELRTSFERDWEALHRLPRLHTTNRSRCHISFDTIARLLCILAASLELLPKTYLLAIGIVDSADNKACDIVNGWIQLYLDCCHYCHDHGQAGIGLLQSVFLFNATLTDKIPKSKQLSLLDAAMRCARQLGLDRLSSAEDDERYWAAQGSEEGLQLATHTAQRRGELTWAVSRLYSGDRRAREYGRTIWLGLVMIESVIPTSFDWRPTSAMDTQAPSLIPPSEGDKPFAFWHLVVDLTTLLQDWTRLRSDCQAHGLGPDYAKVLPLQERLDAILVKWGGTTPLLELKPLDQGGGESRAAFRHRRDQSLQQAWCTFCILAKRMMLQRPFISAAYRSAGKMEGMVRESVRSAVDLIQGARNITEVFGPVPMRSTLPKHSLCQAAMDLILDFFFRPMRLEEDAGISQAQHSLHFVISLLKEDSMNYMPGSLLYDAGNKLEMLLELCARRYESQAKRTSQSYIMSQDESSEEAELDELDEQLKQFGRVIWFFGDTTARLDESSMHSADTIDFDLHTSSIPQPRRSTGNDWESVWHNLLGEVQLNAFF